MRVIKAEPGAVLNLGRLGENESTAVTFDVGAWLAEYPEAGITVLYRLPGTVGAYPVSPGNVSIENGVLTWTITSAELAKEGTGEVELVATKDGIVAKTVIWVAKVNAALDGAGPAPAPWESWQTAMAEIAAEAAQSASDAEAAYDKLLYMSVDGGALPPGGGVEVYKTVDPETGYVTLTFMIGVGETGADGFSPTVTVTEITGGHQVTVTDADGEHTFDVMDGEQGEQGDQGDPGEPGRRGTGVWVITHSPSAYTTPIADIVPVARIALNTVLADTGLDAVYVDDIMHFGTYLFNTGYVDSEYVYFTAATNTAGQSGAAATIAVGTVTTLAPGSNATVTNSGTSSAAVFDIGIPQGATGESGEMGEVPVSGTDPVIAADQNTRYVCGECYTLDFTPSAAGTCSVQFTSGSTPTVLTLPGTVKMPDWWTGVEAGYTYEISIQGGVWGAVMAWAT